MSAAILGILVTALWWTYFDVLAVRTQRLLSRTSGATQPQLARDLYRYLHLPMIAGIVLFALGLKETIEDVDRPLGMVPAAALSCGGLSLYFLTHVVQRISGGLLHPALDDRATGIHRPRPARGRCRDARAHPAALELPALASLARGGGVLRAGSPGDLIQYREDRVEVRRARP